MDRHKNAPTEQALNLSKNCKMGTLEKSFENILATTSEYYSEALGLLAVGTAAPVRREGQEAKILF